MELTFLVDASVLKRLVRPTGRDVIESLAVAGQLARATISDLDVGHSARDAQAWDDLVGALDAMDPVETSVAHVRTCAPGATAARAGQSTRTQGS